MSIPMVLVWTITLLTLGAVSATWVQHEGPGRRPFLVIPNTGDSSLTIATGNAALAEMVTIRATAPFTLLRVEPLRHDPGFELVAARVVFWGAPDVRTASGYRRSPGIPGIVCGGFPFSGHGPSYPAEGLELAPGDDTIKIIYYLRSTTPGLKAAFGHRITYRTTGGRIRTVEGGEGQATHITYLDPVDPPPGGYPEDYRRNCSGAPWTEPDPDYPA